MKPRILFFDLFYFGTRDNIFRSWGRILRLVRVFAWWNGRIFWSFISTAVGEIRIEDRLFVWTTSFRHIIVNSWKTESSEWFSTVRNFIESIECEPPLSRAFSNSHELGNVWHPASLQAQTGSKGASEQSRSDGSSGSGSSSHLVNAANAERKLKKRTIFNPCMEELKKTKLETYRTVKTREPIRTSCWLNCDFFELSAQTASGPIYMVAWIPNFTIDSRNVALSSEFHCIRSTHFALNAFEIAVIL